MACERDRSPRYPPQAQPPPYAAPSPAPTPNPAPAPPSLLGTAITGFGVLIGQLPQMPSELPPLPTLDPNTGWPQWPWPAPTPGPSPTPTPTPAPVPAPSSGWPPAWTAFEDEVLARTNQRRAQGAICGGKAFGPAAAVMLHPALRQSARGHSQDMAMRNYFEHQSPEGRTPAQRAQAAGYPTGFVGENIAAGQPDPASVVQAWVESPGHCVNLMDPRYRYLGVGYFYEESDQYRRYWTQNFGG